MGLFLVHDWNDDGESLDLFVRAADVAEATGHWRKYYDLDDKEPTSVFTVPSELGPDGPINWVDVEGTAPHPAT